MVNYRIWKTDDAYDNYILFKVFNIYDITCIQKEFIEKGYIVIQTEYGVFGHAFIKFKKSDEEAVEE